MIEEKVFGVRVSSDGMKAYLKVSPIGNESFTVKQLENALRFSKVVFGIDYSVLRSIVEENRYYKEIQVAKGIPAEHGTDGYYEYLFDTNVSMKPRILKDGSVDYKSMGEIPVVHEYQELVRYHPATNYISGKNVYGEEVIGKKGKELPALKGKGFLVSDDNQLYTAAINGRAQADITNRRLTVSDVLVLDRDVSTSSGGLYFIGDVVINGNVLAGAEVRAGGSVEVNGCVESAYITAGTDVVLKNGMQGNGRGMIIAGGNVSGKFFEQVHIDAKGTVFANSVMNCDITSEEIVRVSGRFGIIVGGNVRALQEVEATIIGNMAEIPTNIEVGGREDLPKKLNKLEEKLRTDLDNLRKLDALNDKLDQLLRKEPESEYLNEEKKKVMRSRIELRAVVTDMEKEKVEVLRLMEKVSDAKIVIQKTIYPKSTLTISGVSRTLKKENFGVTYKKVDGEVRCISDLT